MNIRNSIGLAAIIASFLIAGVAAAQSVPSSLVAVTSNSVTTTPAAGTSGASITTITLSAPTSGTVAISSIPITLTAGNNGTAANLSNCQVFNSSGTALNTGANIPTLQSGSNTITFDQPLTINSTGSTALTIRCNVASATPSGATFQFVAGQPTFTPSLMVSFNAAPSVNVGTLNSLGIVTLDATRSGVPITVKSLPFTMTASSGNSLSNLSNCSVRDTGSIATALNTGANAVLTPGGSTNFTLDTPITVPAGSTRMLALVCTVNGGAPLAGSFVVSLNPATIGASNNGSTITPTIGLTSTGAIAPTSGTVLLAASTGTGTGTSPTLPNTGEGGNAPTEILVLVVAGLIAVFGVRYLSTRTS